MNLRGLVALLLALCAVPGLAAELRRVEPPNWWVGFVHPTVELMLHGEGIAALEPWLEHRDARISRVTRTDNPNYLFVELTLDPQASPGRLPLQLRRGARTVAQWDYPLLERRPGSATRLGFGAADVIYLITPDRFANGDPGNDTVAGMREPANRSDPNGRHGGDLAGMRQALPYLAGLGITALWPTPLIENDQPAYSYHGYSATDFYCIDPRFGSNEQFREFVAAAGALDIKVIQDIVVNHIGSGHWWMGDLPAADWLNFPRAADRGDFVATNHNRSTIQDPYASAVDRRRFTDGWFVETMPDLNQRQPQLATYLIQNSIWWIEYAGLSGIREDTYSYVDRDFLSEWGRRIMQEYPNFNIVGEEWSPNPLIVAYWQAGKQNHDGYVSHTPSMLDFPLRDALLRALTEPEDWNSGWIRLYEMLGNDHVYADPFQLVTFEGNHDTPRLFAVLDQDFDLYRMALTFLLTVRGIPQLFYGTELAMAGPAHRDDGRIRADFPGGWPDDEVNAFSGRGLSERQQAAMALTRTLLTWRKTASAVHSGRLMHFAPDRGSYTLVRADDRHTVMAVFNKSRDAVTLDLDRFAEVLEPGGRARSVLDGDAFTLGATLTVPGRGTVLLDIPKAED